MTLQSQKNTVYNIAWYATGNEVVDNSNSNNPVCKICDNTIGPNTILPKLEEKTKNWNNVNDLNYSIGKEESTLGYSECENYNKCTNTKYTLSKNNIKARMITIQEATKLGCTTDNKSCPIWMYNYLNASTLYEGTINDTYTENSGGINYAYWFMNTPAFKDRAWYVTQSGSLGFNIIIKIDRGARAVVEINK